jgi:hypothetical protein
MVTHVKLHWRPRTVPIRIHSIMYPLLWEPFFDLQDVTNSMYAALEWDGRFL